MRNEQFSLKLDKRTGNLATGWGALRGRIWAASTIMAFIKILVDPGD